MQRPDRSDGTYYVAAVTQDGKKVLDFSEIDEKEVKSYVSSIGLDVLRNYWRFTINADIDFFAKRTSLPKDLQDVLDVQVGEKLAEFRNRVERLPRNEGFVIVTTYGVRPSDLVHEVPLKQFIDETVRLYKIPSKMRCW